MFEIPMQTFMRMKKLFTVLIISVFALSYTSTKAQPYLNFYLNGSCPMDGLRDSNYRDGLGFSIEFLSPSIFKTKNNRFEVRLGMGFEFLHYGTSRKVRDLTFDTPNSDLGSVKIKNQMTGFYIGPKFIFNFGRVSPYLDVFGASRSFFTNQINEFNETVPGYEKRSTSLLLRNGRAHYGGSFGVIYNLGSGFAFDARVSYSTGTGIKFIDLNSVTRDPDYESNIKYKVTNTTVSNVLIFRVGVLLQIKKCKDCPKRSSGSRRSNTISPAPSRPKKQPAKVKPVPKQPEPEKPINY